MPLTKMMAATAPPEEPTKDKTPIQSPAITPHMMLIMATTKKSLEILMRGMSELIMRCRVMNQMSMMMLEHNTNLTVSDIHH